jgi:hypothetical protein
MRKLLIVLLFISLAGCKGRPIRLFGNFEIVDKGLHSVAIYDANGKKRYLKDESISFEVLGKKSVFIKGKEDKEPWKMRFNSSLSQFLKRTGKEKKTIIRGLSRSLATVVPEVGQSWGYLDQYTYSAKDIGQKYGVKIKRVQVFETSEEVERFDSCWFKHKEWKTSKKGKPLQIETMIKGHQEALMKIETFSEIVTVEFLRKDLKTVVAQFRSQPNIVERAEKIKALDECRGKSVF